MDLTHLKPPVETVGPWQVAIDSTTGKVSIAHGIDLIEQIRLRGQYTAYDGDQVAKWKDELAKRRRQQRRQRGRRSSRVPITNGPGMVRLRPDDRPCVDCGMPTVRRGGPNEWYMVHDRIWQAAGMPPAATLRDYLCIGCLERRLGRQLTAADFTAADVNEPGLHMTPLLLARLTARGDGDGATGDADGHPPGDDPGPPPSAA